MNCKNCGANLSDGAQFCGECGTAVSDPQVDKQIYIVITVAMNGEYKSFR